MEKKTIKILANISATLVPAILIIPFLLRWLCDYEFTPEQYLAYSIGMASPFAALAGYLFVYLSFIHQTNQFQFEKDKMIFDQYLNTYSRILNELEFSASFPSKPFNGSPRFYQITEKKNNAFGLFRNRMISWVEFDWTKQVEEDFRKSVGIPLIPKREDFSFENSTKAEAFMLIKAVAGEKSFGQYFSILEYLLNQIKDSDFPAGLIIFETLLSYEEKIFLYHYCPVMLDGNLVNYLARNGFLKTFPQKHWEGFFKKSFW